MPFDFFSRRRRPYRRVSLWAGWWINLQFFWHTRNKGPWVVALILVSVATILGGAMYRMDANQSETRELACLALNVYYEARGESPAGMYAVAEVTMNRVTSHRHPDTVCGVVYEKRWDRLRKRYVSAFSWTEFDIVPHPEGSQWHQAREIAQAVYFGRQPPVLDGAMHYHASYVKPSWSKGQKPIRRIGGHIFYK
jgi:N-acetylmuramoyl-L-alanine amidase